MCGVRCVLPGRMASICFVAVEYIPRIKRAEKIKGRVTNRAPDAVRRALPVPH